MDPATRTIGFIGGGHMTSAIVRGLLQAGHPPRLIRIGEPDSARRMLLHELHGDLGVGTDNAAVATAADVLVLAVKPQVMAGVCTALAGRTGNARVILSIAAGIPLASLRRWLGDEPPLVRAMPNQPALVGAGISALVAGPGVSSEACGLAHYVAAGAGDVVWLQDENLLDAVTALSGSGPAYFYLLVELLEQAGARLGLPPPLARALARATARGAGRVVAESERDAAELRASVTSPGGTTEAALQVFSQADLAAIVLAAVTAARDRAAALGRATGSGREKHSP